MEPPPPPLPLPQPQSPNPCPGDTQVSSNMQPAVSEKEGRRWWGGAGAAAPRKNWGHPTRHQRHWLPKKDSASRPPAHHPQQRDHANLSLMTWRPVANSDRAGRGGGGGFGGNGGKVNECLGPPSRRVRGKERKGTRPTQPNPPTHSQSAVSRLNGTPSAHADAHKTIAAQSYSMRKEVRAQGCEREGAQAICPHSGSEGGGRHRHLATQPRRRRCCGSCPPQRLHAI
jgi:hypothetical protein